MTARYPSNAISAHDRAVLFAKQLTEETAPPRLISPEYLIDVYTDMVAKFKSMIDAGKLQVEFRDGLILVKLPDNILFDSGKTDLKPAGQEAIKQVTTWAGSLIGLLAHRMVQFLNALT